MGNQLPERLEQWVLEGLEQGASDLFLIPGEPLAFRVNGAIQRTDGDALDADSIRDLAAQIIGEQQLLRIGPDIGRFQCWRGCPGEYNTRVCVARSHGDYTIVLQLMPARICSLDEISAPKALIDAILSPNGLVVVSGVIGSGKTTTAYALIDHINATADGCHICTVEGPSHLAVPPKKGLVQQREIGVDVPTALAGIQAAAGQDLDVLFVGDISEIEVLQACITLAQTGHLVIIQMHSPTAADALRRLTEAFPEDVRRASVIGLARVLRIVTGQCLLPRADGGGQIPAYGLIVPDDELRDALVEGRDFMARRTPWPAGCQSEADEIERLRTEGSITDEAAADALRRL